MKKHLLILTITLLCFQTIFATSASDIKTLRAIWASTDPLKTRADEASKLKSSKLNLRELMAYNAIIFQYGNKNIKAIAGGVRNLEGFTPSMIIDMDTCYPKSVNLYTKQAGTKPLYRFTIEPTRKIGFAELATLSEKEPTNIMDAIYWETAKIQQELIQSIDLIIEPRFQRLSKLYASLDSAQAEQVKSEHYIEFWNQQKELYYHKYTNQVWACTCGSPKKDFPSIPSNCTVPKVIDLTIDGVKIDNETKTLAALEGGDLSVLTTISYSAAKKNIVSELIWLYGAGLGSYPTLKSQPITLVNLWNEGEAKNSNEYNTRLGFDSAKVARIQEHYECVLGLPSIQPKTYESGNAALIKNTDSLVTDTKQKVAAIEDSLAKVTPPDTTTVVKEEEHVLPRKPVKGRTETIITKKKPISMAEMQSIAAELQPELQKILDLHDALGGCVQTEAVDATTLEIKVTGCGLNNKGLFAIGETENVIAADFYDVCGNLVYVDVIKPFQDKFGGALQLTVTGTADSIRCVSCSNDTIAQKRANGVVAHLGPKLLEAATKNGRTVKTLVLTDQPERKVVIRIELIYPKFNKAS